MKQLVELLRRVNFQRFIVSIRRGLCTLSRINYVHAEIIAAGLTIIVAPAVAIQLYYNL